MYPLDRKLNKPQSQSGCSDEEKIVCPRRVFYTGNITKMCLNGAV
jgi:hypothetical protein